MSNTDKSTDGGSAQDDSGVNHCRECGWEGPNEAVDSRFLPLGQSGFGDECLQWDCPECGTPLEVAA